MSLLLTGTAVGAHATAGRRVLCGAVLIALALGLGLTAGSDVALAADSDVSIKTGFRIHNDWGWFSGDDDLESAVGPLLDGTEMRRGRIELSGTLDEQTEFKAQYDFAGGKAKFRDVYIGLKGLPVVGHVRVGNQKEPFGLEEMTSSNDISLLERSLANAFMPSRHSGILVQNAVLNDRATWSAGVFRNTDSYGNATADGEYNLTARVTALPWSSGDGDLVHVGGAVSRRSPAGDAAAYGSVPEAHLLPEFVSTGELTGVESVLLAGGEGAVVYGPFSLQGEVVVAQLNADALNDPQFNAWYVQATLCPTGEKRSYKAGAGAFGTVKPKRDFLGPDKGPGAWEVALRLSRIDLVDGPVQGGKLTDITAGVNWYLNARTRIMTDYVFADLKDVGQANMLTTRFQVSY